MSVLNTTRVTATGQATASSARTIPTLRSNFAWTFVSNFFYAGCQWGMLSAIAKLGTPSIVGEFTLGLAIGAPVFMFTNLQLRAVQATDVQAECRFADYFTLRLLTTLLGLLAIAALLPFAAASSAVSLAILLVAVSKSVECLSDVIAGLLQREERLKLVSISLIIRGCGSVLVFVLTFAYFRNLTLSIAAMSGIWLAVVLFYDVPNAKALLGHEDGFFRFDVRELRRLILLGLPMGWVATLISLNFNVPRYFLQHYMGLADQGIFASLSYLVVVINLVVVALSQSVTTRLARMFADRQRRQFVAILFKLSMLGATVVLVGVPLSFLVGRQLLILLYRPEYGEHVGLLALLVATTGVSTVGSFLFCGITAARAFRIQVPVYFAALLVGVAGAALLTPRWGLIGAGVSLLFSNITLLMGGLLVLRRVLNAPSEELRAG
jgi:O-antigen/teichoic acid export membrane protein